MDIIELWNALGRPLLRLIFFISLGLMIGNIIEALNWTRFVAKLAQPVTGFARLKDIAGASFSLAFFSGVAANSMLSEGYDKGNMSRQDLVFANLFNSMPTYFLHLPTMFFLTVPFIGSAGVLYVGLTFLSAILRTIFIVVLGHFVLPPLTESCVPCRLDEHKSNTWQEALHKSWQRFKKRIKRVNMITVPIYIAVFFLNRHGAFAMLEDFLSEHVGVFSWLPPEALSIVVLHVAAEFAAGLATAGALLENGTIQVKDVVLALLIGNVMSSPMRMFRHQFPYYAGIFKPALAMRLIVYNQALRMSSIILVALAYAVLG
jgi:hypothetical protein